MNVSTPITCPKCGSSNLVAKYEATYVYSYIIDSDAPGRKNKEEFLPFLFENRDKIDCKQYMKCSDCGAAYPCSFGPENEGVDLTILRKAVRSDLVENPEFLG
jgi:DNA-directed RNA polymerase subunit RPC12/RpoP